MDNFMYFLHFCSLGRFPLTIVLQGHLWVGLQYIVHSFLTFFSAHCANHWSTRPCFLLLLLLIMGCFLWGIDVGQGWRGEAGDWATGCTNCSYLLTCSGLTLCIHFHLTMEFCGVLPILWFSRSYHTQFMICGLCHVIIWCPKIIWGWCSVFPMD